MGTININTLFDIKGKTALITGATGGLGKALSEGFVAAGAKVVLTGRSKEKLKPLAQTLAVNGGEVAYVAGDPANPADVKRVVAEAKTAFQRIDILVTAAGMNKVGPITEQPVEDWLAVMDANLKGTYLFCKEVGKVMIEQGKGGKVILVGSARGHLGLANYTAYAPSKAAVHLLAKTLGCEWGKYKINVNAIAPTVFRTDLTQWMFDDQAFFKKFLERIPIGRLGEPEDFIGTVIFLASKASDFLTGAIIDTDGGYTAG
jgi:NAD(P)-dependent dehydrogenase (short-subunit alcohol dehydrogenase family)